ncbi:helix-turn-helix domain-containing protein [Eubacterium maltosivorans]|uniref:HTH cro/C1-type domain-containing protein n=1 Tax=Eubacterium maltosivorans TaxID=2041044 RepID=A0A4P9C894_EUBML|nr:hypothetical protein CPZ25_005765 [Eubacterium maltosivorans]
MDEPTKFISEYIKEKRINLTKLSNDTEIPYMSIYDSLSNKSRDRDLRVGEYMKICCYLGIEPMEYMKINNSKKTKN